MLFRRERRQSDISIHAPARGATPLSWGGVQEMSISIHAPARGATVRCRFPTTATAYFNPRPREGGDRVLNSSYDPSYSFQSTPPRGGRRRYSRLSKPVRGISIHAPARGATLCSRRRWRPGRFQSTPPRGGRPHPQGRAVRRVGISIHAPARGATKGVRTAMSKKIISIHAPARGATSRERRAWPCGRTFQSTPPRGGRPYISRSKCRQITFQSTPPRGGRQQRCTVLPADL